MTIDLDGKNIYYERQGRGDTLLLVHGWGGSSKSLKPIWELASKHFDAIVIDMPGFGRSDNPNSGWGMIEYGLVLHKFIQKLNLKKVNYFGHSFGGGLGIFLASEYPDEIDTLILSGSAFRREMKVSVGVKTIKSQLLSKLPFYDKWQSPLRRIVYKIFFRNSDLTKFPQLESNYRKIITQEFVEYAPMVKQPTLILWGDEDTYTPVRYAHEIHEKIPGSEIKIFPGKRHNLPLVHSDIVFKEIKKFLRIH